MRIDVNIISAEEHVPEIERYIRTVKERTIAIYNSLSFNRFSTRVIIEMVRAMGQLAKNISQTLRRV